MTKKLPIFLQIDVVAPLAGGFALVDVDDGAFQRWRPVHCGGAIGRLRRRRRSGIGLGLRCRVFVRNRHWPQGSVELADYQLN